MRSSYRQPSLGEGFVSEITVDRVLSQTAYLRRSLPALFHPASTLSGSLRSPPSPRGEGFVSRKAVSSYRSLPHWGRGTASAVDRVLSFIVDLRRSFPLFFIPLEPYPARSARHLPHAGKALIQKYHFPHPTSAFPSRLCFGYSRILVSQPSPLGKGDRVSGG